MDLKCYTDAVDEATNSTTNVEKDVVLRVTGTSYVIICGVQQAVQFHQDGKITIFEDGECATRKFGNKLNKYTPDCINVFQRDFKFYVKFYDVILPFNKSFTFDPFTREVFNENLGVY